MDEFEDRQIAKSNRILRKIKFSMMEDYKKFWEANKDSNEPEPFLPLLAFILGIIFWGVVALIILIKYI